MSHTGRGRANYIVARNYVPEVVVYGPSPVFAWAKLAFEKYWLDRWL